MALWCVAPFCWHGLRAWLSVILALVFTAVRFCVRLCLCGQGLRLPLCGSGARVHCRARRCTDPSIWARVACSPWFWCSGVCAPRCRLVVKVVLPMCFVSAWDSVMPTKGIHFHLLPVPWLLGAAMSCGGGFSLLMVLTILLVTVSGR